MSGLKRVFLLVGNFFFRLSYEKMTLDKVNQKMIKPVPGLVIDGEQYYEFVNLADMPDARFNHFLDFDREFTMGMDRTTIVDYMQKIIEANNRDDKSRVGSLAFMLSDSVANCTPLSAMYNMSALLYFTRKEDLRCFDGDFNQAKIELFKKFPDQSFFLTKVLEDGFRISGSQLPEDIRAYLTRSMVKLNAYNRIRSGQSV